MQMTSLGLVGFSSGVVPSRKESSDFLSRWLVGGGGPLVETKMDREFSAAPSFGCGCSDVRSLPNMPAVRNLSSNAGSALILLYLWPLQFSSKRGADLERAELEGPSVVAGCQDGPSPSGLFGMEASFRFLVQTWTPLNPCGISLGCGISGP